MKAKRIFFINYNGTRTQIAAPENWNNDKLSLARHDDIKTVVRAVSIDDPVFMFDDTTDPVNGSTLIQSIFEADGADAYATLEVQYLKNDGITESYEPLYTGYLNFGSYSLNAVDKSVSVTLTDSNLLEKFNNRKDIDVRTDETTSLDNKTVTALDADDITLQKQELTRTALMNLKLPDFNGRIVDTESGNILHSKLTVGDSNVSHREFNACIASSTDAPDKLNSGSVNSGIIYDDDGLIDPKTIVSGKSEEALKVYISSITVDVGFRAYDYRIINTDLVRQATIKMTLKVYHSGSLIATFDSTSDYIQNGTFRDLNFRISDTQSISRTLDYNDTLSYYFSSEIISEVVEGGTGDESLFRFTNYKITRSLNVDGAAFIRVAYETTVEKTGGVKTVLKPLNYLSSDIQDQFIDEGQPAGGEVGAYKYISTSEDYIVDFPKQYINKDAYTKSIKINIGSQTLDAVRTEIFSTTAVAYLRIYAVVVDKNNTISSYEQIDSIFLSSSETSYNIDAQEIDLQIKSGYSVQLYIAIRSVMNNQDIVNVNLSQSTPFQYSIKSVSPDDSTIKAFNAFEVLSHIADVTIGEGKLVINNDIVSLANKDNLNSGYGLYIARGSYIRGFGSTYDGLNGSPLSVDFLTLYDSLAKLLGLGLSYEDGYFYLDYLENIYNSHAINIGEVSGLEITSASDIAKKLKVGDATVSDIEDFYLTNEGHNTTTYAYPTITAQDTEDYTTKINTCSIPVEIIRRNNATDTADLSLNSDSLLYFIKCYDGTKSEKEERISITSAPDNFGDLNLCFLPSYIIENNKKFLGKPFYKKSNTAVLKFMSSQYGLDLTTTYNSITFVEQSDVLKTEIGSQYADPIEYKFRLPITDEILSEITSYPNSVITFTSNGNTYYGRIKTDTDLDIFMRDGEWTLEKAN